MKNEKMPFLPRFGVELKMPADNEYLSYLGRGPVESYEDKRHASRFGSYRSTVTEHFEHYIRPQENMAHTDTRLLNVTDVADRGLTFSACGSGEKFSFNCSHFTPDMLANTRYDYELVPLSETVVSIDYRQSGIGSGSCGPQLSEELRLSDSNISFAFKIQPCFEF